MFMKKSSNQTVKQIKGIRTRKKKDDSIEISKDHKRGIKVVKVNNININFSKDNIIFRSYKKNNEELNKKIKDMNVVPFTEDIIREKNTFVPDRDYDLVRFSPSIKNDKVRFSKTFINGKCYCIFDAYVEYINNSYKNLIFEVEPIDNVI